jgi:hypothetical protein
MEAAFPKPPQVQNYGGQVLGSPTFYAVFFSGDDSSVTGPLGDFTTNIGASAYWTGAVSEYGVGPATGHVIQLTEAAGTNLQDQDIQTWLVGKFGTDPLFPAAPGPNDVYIMYYPQGVNVDLEGMQSCQTFGGYHNAAQLSDGSGVSYAVVPRCNFGMGSLLDTATSSASHELIEAVTDPQPMSQAPGYLLPDDADIDWVDAVGGGEIGDLCAQNPQAFTTFPPFNYVVQRVWSNKAAAAGHDPCQPTHPGEVYYNAAPVFTQMVNYSIQGQAVPVHGIKIPVGGTGTVPVDFYSDGPIAAWPVKGYDYSSTFMGGPSLLTLTLTPPTGENGTKGTLTIKVDQAGANNQELFFLASSNDNGATVNWWFGAVTN